ncbi:MAG: hypothetical protein U5J63_09415 [Fodinibius sp.]|nr:hypothetical protein [Fodinibius sp.]
MKKSIVLLIMLGIWTGLAGAQSAWLSDSRLSSVSLEWDKPLFDDRTLDRDLITGATSVLFVTARLRVNDNFRVVGELPISHFGFENTNPLGDDNSTVIGNIYAGGIWDMNMRNPNNHAFIELGVRIPTAPESMTDRFGGMTGLLSENERVEAFTTDNWAIPLVGNFVTSISGPFAMKFRLGTIYDIYVDDLESFDNEFHLLYGLTGLYRESNFEAHLGFSGRNPYAGNSPDFFDDGFTQIRAGIARPFRNITPGVYVRKPLGENYNQLVDFAYGFSIEIRG